MTPPRSGKPEEGDDGDRNDPQGSLFGRFEEPPAPGTRARPLTIGDLNRSVQARIEASHPNLWVVGEISNLSRYSSGHLYFTLKDSASEIAAVMFAGANRKLRFTPRDGVEALALGRPTLWVPRGRYQFVVEEMEPRGRGSLLEAFEALKQRLGAEGLFDQARKRPIPVLPTRIGIVTSPDGAALRDILRVLRRRYADVAVLIAPARVQGEGAAAEIAGAIGGLARMPGIDVLIVGRGGGSIEDLWAFNEEIVARAIAASPIPVISAVGHETDVTIADFAADVRAATPSQAAELVVASREDLAERLGAACARLIGAVRFLLEQSRRSHDRLAGRTAITGFPAMIGVRAQLIDELASRMIGAVRDRLISGRSTLRESALRLAPRHLREVLARRRERGGDLHGRLLAAIGAGLRERRAMIAGRIELLRSLSPVSVLDRGYAICLDPVTGAALRSASQVAVGSAVEVRLARGEIDCRVIGTRPEQEEGGR